MWFFATSACQESKSDTHAMMVLTDLDSSKDLITATLGRPVTPKVAQASEVVDQLRDVMTLGAVSFRDRPRQGPTSTTSCPVYISRFDQQLHHFSTGGFTVPI